MLVVEMYHVGVKVSLVGETRACLIPDSRLDGGLNF